MRSSWGIVFIWTQTYREIFRSALVYLFRYLLNFFSGIFEKLCPQLLTEHSSHNNMDFGQMFTSKIVEFEQLNANWVALIIDVHKLFS